MGLQTCEGDFSKAMSASSGHSSGITSEKLGIIDSSEEGVSCGAALGLVTVALGVEVDGAWDL